MHTASDVPSNSIKYMKLLKFSLDWLKWSVAVEASGSNKPASWEMKSPYFLELSVLSNIQLKTDMILLTDHLDKSFKINLKAETIRCIWITRSSLQVYHNHHQKNPSLLLSQYK